MSGDCATAGTLACYGCLCLTWNGLLGFVLPSVMCLVYLKRVAKEATVNDWMLMLLFSVITYATKEVRAEGVAHDAWYLRAAVLWAILACSTDRIRSLPSIPMIGVFTYVSILMPDIASAIHDRPPGMYGAPGGNGLLDGLVLKPVMAMGMFVLVYALKVWPILPNKHRRGKMYDKASRDFLLNVSPFYERPDEWDARLTLVPKASSSTEPKAA